MSPQDFKDALACWASGVAVVTADQDGLLYGLTVSSFTSVSLTPPLVLVCLAETNRMPAMLGGAGRFAISVLAEGQESASDYFARSGREPTRGFTEIDGDWTPAGRPLVAGAMGWLGCDVHALHDGGDHTIVVGRVVEAAARVDARPLVYWQRAYRTFGG